MERKHYRKMKKKYYVGGKMDTRVFKLEPKRAWEFPSKSTPGKWYTTRLNVNGTLSCNCPGWTLRVGRDGTRECIHTKQVARELGEVLEKVYG